MAPDHSLEGVETVIDRDFFNPQFDIQGKKRCFKNVCNFKINEDEYQKFIVQREMETIQENGNT